MKQNMKCRRCGGKMMETYSDLLSPSERGEDAFVWRCINCGNYIDQQVLANRPQEPYHKRGIGMDMR